MKKRRILTALLAMVMLLSAVPFGAMAAEKAPAAPAAKKGSTYLSKTATLENDGSYTIDMEAYATGLTEIIHKTDAVPLDIVLVLDQSYSMKRNKNGEVDKDHPQNQRLWALKQAAKNFVDSIYKNQIENPDKTVKHNVAVVGFASNNDPEREWAGTGLFDGTGKFKPYGSGTNSKCILKPADFKSALVPASRKDVLFKSIDSLSAEGDTYPEYGLEMANKIFENNPIPADSNRKRVVVMFTDGVPAEYGSDFFNKTMADNAIAQAATAKDKHHATVYCVGLFSGNPGNAVNEYLHQVSSGPKNGASYTPGDKFKVYSNKLDRNRSYYVMNGSSYTEVMYREKKDGWVDSNDKKYTPKSSSSSRKDTQFYDEKTGVLDSKYSMIASDMSSLNDIFDTISQDISKPSTSVTLDAKSILRDIMSQEGFKLTSQSRVVVSIVPGTTADDKTYQWGTPVGVLTLTDPADGAFATGTYQTMTIEASTHMANPEAGKKDLDTVDVTGFDYKDQYISTGHAGSKLVVKITGVKALPSVTTDKNIYTNFNDPAQPDNLSGIWSPKETHAGKYVMELPFPDQPQTHMPSKSYVVDYAKPLELAIADFKLTAAENLDADGYDPFASAVTAIAHKYGDVRMAANGNLTYVPKTMNWDGYDTFYVFGKTDDAAVTSASANANGNVWAKVNVIPANNVYYEDTFESGKEVDGTALVGITYTGSWTEIPEAPGTTTKPEDGSNADDNHGWIPVLDGSNGDSDGTAHHGRFDSADNLATASFTFTGTGVDVYSRTNGETGTIVATLTDQSGKLVAKKIVDTLSASGTYYQVPTLSFHHDRNKAALDGTYQLTIQVSGNAKTRLDYYLDGIRVYNPIKNGDSVVDEAYGPDERNASFIEIRDKLLDQKSFDAGQTTANGPVFIDQLHDGSVNQTTASIAVYENRGAKNEVYLAKNQSITFKVDTASGNQYQIGLKSLEQDKKAIASYNGASGKVNQPVGHTADMFYDVKDVNGFITITKLKVTNAAAAVNTAAVFMEAEVPALLSATQTFNEAPVAPEVPTEPTEPETQPTEPDVDIENPTEPEPQPEKPSRPSIRDILDKIFGGIFGWN